MKPHQPSTQQSPPRPAPGFKTPILKFMQKRLMPERPSARAARLLVLVGVVALLSGALFGASSASTSATRRAEPRQAAPHAPAAEMRAAGRAEAAGRAPFAQPNISLAPWAALFSGPETVSTFAADCHTASASFNVGDTICVAVSGAPAGTPPLRRLFLIDPDGKVRDSADVTTSSTTVSFTLPSDATFTIPGCDPGGNETCSIDNRGVWRVVLADTSEVAAHAVALFAVHDPSKQVADLSVAKVLFDVNPPTAGSNVTYRIYVLNNGPDAASNVRFSDATPPNTTFVSFTQDDGPAFTCTPPAVGTAGTTNCTRSSLLKGEAATFTATYLVSTGIANGGDLTDTLNVTSDTFDRHAPDNSSTAVESATNNTPPVCSISCPANISQDNDPNLAGAAVTFNDPTTTGSCSTVSCDHPSGSFFPIGSTAVKCSDTTNQFSCNFVVTINDKRTVKVALNGPASQTVECRTGFTDQGATATDKDGNSLSVTTTVTVPDPGGAVDQNGDAVQVPVSGVDPNTPNTYTITYSATDGTTTATATRVVQVVDTTPPVITLAGTSGFTPQTVQVTVVNDDGTTSVVTETILVATVECHTNFTAPTATAADGCDNHAVAVTTSGSVDANTPGTYEIVYTATDAAGNDTESRVRVTVVDTTAPTITAPPAVTLYTGPGATSCGVTVSDIDAALGTATAIDSCSSSVTVTRNGVPAGNTFTGTTTITYTATDASGNHSSATQTVTVVDNTPPTITAPPAVTVTADPLTCAMNVPLGTPTTNDNCSVASVTNNAPSSFHSGTTTVTWTVTDTSGNTATATQLVTVNDVTPPVLTVLGASPLTVECHTTFDDPGATATDACDGSVAVSASNNVNVNTPGTYSVTYTAHDAAGNTATATRVVQVVDTTPPVITTNGQTLSMWPPNHKYVTWRVTDFVTAVTDSCNTSLGISDVVIEKVTSDEPDNGGGGDGDTLNDMVIASDCKSVQLRAERNASGDGRVYTITFKVTDASGNVGRATARVVVPHDSGHVGSVVDSGVHNTVNGSCP